MILILHWDRSLEIAKSINFEWIREIKVAERTSIECDENLLPTSNKRRTKRQALQYSFSRNHLAETQRWFWNVRKINHFWGGQSRLNTFVDHTSSGKAQVISEVHRLSQFFWPDLRPINLKLCNSHASFWGCWSHFFIKRWSCNFGSFPLQVRERKCLTHLAKMWSQPTISIARYLD